MPETVTLTAQNQSFSLGLILGDQLDPQSPVLRSLNPAVDMLWMAEVRDESTHVWSHQARITLFLSAMRHYRDRLREQGWRVEYQQIDDTEAATNLVEALRRTIALLKPDRLIVVQPGDWRVLSRLQSAARELGLPLTVLDDTHFLSTPAEFATHAEGRKQLRMEFFYREMRRKTGVLMETDGQPTGGEWNFDAENRGSFGKAGPGTIPLPVRFLPDAITLEVMASVQKLFKKHPGSLEFFDWPVTPEQAHRALDDFIQHRLPNFGQYQDAMWQSEPFLYHSRLAAAMNLKLLHPMVVIRAAEMAYRRNQAPLAAVEGFIRQILGWREYVRGIYWTQMPQYLERNALGASEPLPAFYWTGRTEMACLRDALAQTLKYGYAHHIQRLMVTGLYSLLLGVQPQAVHEWYLAVYVDAVEWVELPNTLGMSQFADGGVMASKPYVATGAYIKRMSNYCQGCRFDPADSEGERACPFTVLYWDFLLNHERVLASNPRMTMQLRNLARLSPAKRDSIRARASEIRRHHRAEPAPTSV